MFFISIVLIVWIGKNGARSTFGIISFRLVIFIGNLNFDSRILSN
jgi:hypothetical protein